MGAEVPRQVSPASGASLAGEAARTREPDSEPPGGPFPTWNALYAAVLASLGLVIALLWVLTLITDHSAP